MPPVGRPGAGGVGRIVAPIPIVGGPANGLVFGDSIATGLASRIAILRPGDTAWNEVVQANFGLESTAGDVSGSGAIGTGSNSFKVKGHDVYYVPGARNLVWLICIGHRDVQDVRDSDIAIMSRYKTLYDEARALGWQVCGSTVLATTEYNDPGGSPYTRPNRIAINEALRSGGLGQPIRAGAHYLVDTDLIVDQAAVGASGTGAPYLSDGIHPSSTGQDALASAFNSTVP